MLEARNARAHLQHIPFNWHGRQILGIDQMGSLIIRLRELIIAWCWHAAVAQWVQFWRSQGVPEDEIPERLMSFLLHLLELRFWSECAQYQWTHMVCFSSVFVILKSVLGRN